ncbi:helix-turn-helix domain-containing protein [Enterococcus cecorum]|nr:helix-turn-helix transcriptional regulator [Enterococcus cecorum]CAI3455124.1 helix-turn-helix transcriptional regulator [Enterococcus cecorum]CAI3465866.1 helix-turn-helix transcriptional regulator [Enterococcus cecorum]CAI3466294.1 helix-turn-helix transcriptional regulator [Enterococcus cecorum]CAI3490104.1 helix-turn-helix transcriptional regulator [Enterococcus cecorum]
MNMYSEHELVQPVEFLPIWYELFNEQPLSQIPTIIPSHWHRGIELSYTYSGTIDEFVINKEVFSTQPKTILVINSREIHSIKTTANGSALSIIFPYNYVKNLYPNIDSFELQLNKPELFTDIQHNQYQQIQVLCQEFFTLANEKKEYYQFDLYILVLQILKKLVQYFRVPKQALSQQSIFILNRLQKITDYLEENYQQSISLDELAMYMHLSKEYLSRFFKQHMQLTIGEYLRNIRIQSAYTAIVNSSETLTNIAFANGFSGLRSMNRALESRYAMTASDIRAKKGK